MNYYNEFDPHAAAWLRELINQKLIPAGDVDTRSIADVTPSDLHGYTQCHFFAGIGGWSLALQISGWPDDRPVWTGSCPCQPFSVAGEGKGTADERHLWPVFFALIRACNPPIVLGEQVASAAVLGSSAKPSKRSAGKAVQPVWLDGVFADLESAGYACGSSDIPAAGVGAPHIRQRCWWGAVRMADSSQSRLEGHAGNGDHGNQPGWNGTNQAGSVAEGGESRRMGHAPSGGLGIIGDAALTGSGGHAHGSGECGGAGDSDSQSTGRHTGSAHAAEAEHGTREGDDHGFVDAGNGVSQFWSESRWHPCRDGKYRRVPVEPGLFPLADGLPYRVAQRRTVRPPLLRGAGNAICPEVAAVFVKAFLESI